MRLAEPLLCLLFLFVFSTGTVQRTQSVASVGYEDSDSDDADEPGYTVGSSSDEEFEHELEMERYDEHAKMASLNWKVPRQYPLPWLYPPSPPPAPAKEPKKEEVVPTPAREQEFVIEKPKPEPKPQPEKKKKQEEKKKKQEEKKKKQEEKKKKQEEEKKKVEEEKAQKKREAGKEKAKKELEKEQAKLEALKKKQQALEQEQKKEEQRKKLQELKEKIEKKKKEEAKKKKEEKKQEEPKEEEAEEEPIKEEVKPTPPPPQPEPKKESPPTPAPAPVPPSPPPISKAKLRKQAERLRIAQDKAKQKQQQLAQKRQQQQREALRDLHDKQHEELVAQERAQILAKFAVEAQRREIEQQLRRHELDARKIAQKLQFEAKKAIEAVKAKQAEQAKQEAQKAEERKAAADKKKAEADANNPAIQKAKLDLVLKTAMLVGPDGKPMGPLPPGCTVGGGAAVPPTIITSMLWEKIRRKVMAKYVKDSKMCVLDVLTKPPPTLVVSDVVKCFKDAAKDMLKPDPKIYVEPKLKLPFLAMVGPNQFAIDTKNMLAYGKVVAVNLARKIVWMGPVIAGVSACLAMFPTAQSAAMSALTAAMDPMAMGDSILMTAPLMIPCVEGVSAATLGALSGPLGPEEMPK